MSNSNETKTGGSKCFHHPQNDCPKDPVECKGIVDKCPGEKFKGDGPPCRYCSEKGKCFEYRDECANQFSVIMDIKGSNVPIPLSGNAESIHDIHDRWEAQARVGFYKSRSELDGD